MKVTWVSDKEEKYQLLLDPRDKLTFIPFVEFLDGQGEITWMELT